MDLPESLLKKLNPGSPGIELTYLQIFLDRIFSMAVDDLKNNTGRPETTDLHFSIN